MNVQATPSPYESLSVPQPSAGSPPVLGQPVPGMTGGLPAQGGLSVLANPMAQELQSYGRGDDTMLVHMTPNEVNSLQGLAMATGGSLTINPHTGLPEAGWLGKLLPTILGGIGMAFGIPPIWMGAAGAVGGTIATGDLGKGLMAGLQAYGGASMAGGLGLGNKLGNVGASLGLPGSQAANIGAQAARQASATALEQTAQQLPGMETAFTAPTAAAMPATASPAFAESFGGLAAPSAVPAVAPGAVDIAGLGGATAAPVISTSVPSIAGAPAPTGFLGKFGAVSRAGLPGGIIGKAAPMLAAQGVLSGVSSAMTPSYRTSEGKIDNSYQGPYTAQRRTATFAPTTEELLASTKERDYFDIDMPEVYNMQGQVVQPGSQTAPGTPIFQPVLNPNAKKGQPMYNFVSNRYMGGEPSIEEARMARMYPRVYGQGFAEGGEVELADGAFVVDARTVSELGNGSSNAGIEMLSRMGGRPVRGPGDGVSDSVPARIGRDQPARVARDEVVFSPESVRRIGKGDEKRGAKKLYAMMEKAHKARKKAGRGSDTKLRKGLA